MEVWMVRQLIRLRLRASPRTPGARPSPLRFLADTPGQAGRIDRLGQIRSGIEQKDTKAAKVIRPQSCSDPSKGSALPLHPSLIIQPPHDQILCDLCDLLFTIRSSTFLFSALKPRRPPAVWFHGPDERVNQCGRENPIPDLERDDSSSLPAVVHPAPAPGLTFSCAQDAQARPVEAGLWTAFRAL